MSAKTQTIMLAVDNARGTIEVVWLGENRLRVVDLSISLFSETVAYGDIVDVRKEGKRYVVVSIVERGDYKSFAYVLPEGWNEKQEVLSVLKKVIDHGGHWEGLFGGVLQVVLPGGVDYDPSEDVHAAAGAAFQ